MRKLRFWTPIVCAPAIALIGSLALQPGCASKTGCLNCHISGVMANPDQPSSTPSSALEVQLQDSNGAKVTAVEVTVINANGESETHRYEGGQVSGINDSSPTSIPDPELYDVNGQPPTKATIEITLSKGKKVEDSLGIEPEGSIQ